MAVQWTDKAFYPNHHMDDVGWKMSSPSAYGLCVDGRSISQNPARYWRSYQKRVEVNCHNHIISLELLDQTIRYHIIGINHFWRVHFPNQAKTRILTTYTHILEWPIRYTHIHLCFENKTSLKKLLFNPRLPLGRQVGHSYDKLPDLGGLQVYIWSGKA